MNFIRVLPLAVLAACSSSGTSDAEGVATVGQTRQAAATVDPRAPSSSPPAPPVCAARPVAEDQRGAKVGALEFIGGVSLLGVTANLGGLSGLEARLDADGAARLTAIADDGHRLDLVVALTEGRIGAVACDWSAIAGRDPAAGKRESDAEGLTALPDGRLAVSFERDHRIEILGGSAAVGPRFTPTPDLASNQGLEALARLTDGALIAGGETPDVFARPHPVWRFASTDDPAKPFADSAEPSFFIATEPGYGLTSFDLAPDGSLILLKRFWTRSTGAIISVERLAPGVAETATGIERPERLARLSRSGPTPVDNFEGVAAMTGPDGATWLWLISDDNFNAEQSTYLFAFRLADQAATLPGG